MFSLLGIQQFCHELSEKINIRRAKGKKMKSFQTPIKYRVFTLGQIPFTDFIKEAL